MDLNVLNNLLDPDFASETVASFIEKTLDKAQGVISGITETIDLIPEDDTPDALPTLDTVTKIFEDNGLSPNSILCFSNVTSKVSNLCSALTNNLSKIADGELDIQQIPLACIANDTKETVTRKLGDCVDALKDSIGSAACTVAAIAAAAQADVADRVAVFNNKISSIINSQSAVFSRTVSYFRNMLNTSGTSTQITSSILNATGFQNLDDSEGGASFDLARTEFSEYTGASPIPCFAVGAVADAAVTALKVIFGAVGAAFTAITSFAQYVWSQLTAWWDRTFVNPYDVKVIHGSKVPCFYNMQWQSTPSDLGEDGGTFSVKLEQWMDVNQLQKYLDSHANEWYYIKTVGGEVAYKYSSIKLTLNAGTLVAEAKILGGTTLFKPYSLNPKAIDPKFNIANDGVLSTLDLQTVQLNMANLADSSYLSTDATEQELHFSFACGTAVTCGVLLGYVLALKANAPARVSVSLTNPRLDTVTNLDFLKMATGYMGTDPSGLSVQASVEVNAGPRQERIAHITTMGLGQLMAGLIIMVGREKLKSVADIYVPYLVNRRGMSAGCFVVKTDAENSAVAARALTAMVIATVVLVTAVSAAVVVSKIKKRLFWKRYEFVGQMDNKMWNGKQLTPKEKKKYKRYSRKLNACSYLEQGLSDAVAEAATTPVDTVCSVASTLSGSDTEELTLSNIRDIINKI